MERNITSLGNEYMDNAIKKIKELGTPSAIAESRLDKTLGLIDIEYRDDIKNELNALKESDRMLIGDIMAICKRSDRILGRPEEDCKNIEESLYVIVEPSKEAIITCRDINNIAVQNGKFKFLSLNYMVEQILEFNFTYLQIALGSEVQVFNNYYKVVSSMLKELGKKKNDDIYTKLMVTKAINTANGVLSDIDSGKIDKEQINNRLFFIYNVVRLAETYLEDKIVFFYKKGLKIDIKEYNKYIKKYSVDSKTFIKKKIDELEKAVEEFPVVDKEYAKTLKISIKSKILEDIVKEILLGEQVNNYDNEKIEEEIL